ncbi:hypothetical protein [Nocardia sp. NRRL S-836]|uniref:hypothetical protein n=1 Tax=Nocardia sp. NRRL S-836 TaxID=1519492 RepID=UPI0006AF13D0|nr:hypothetical protein [Nocardia sp. NRRL S-836]KOV89693.1 hypothetical protein ADL03_02390 [Nocardia sp. NRRL S-836]
MNPVPQHRTLLGVDVIGSAQLPPHLLAAVPATVSKLLDAALSENGIERDAVLSIESPGDGTLLVLPSELLGATIDAAVHLDQLTTEHNRWHKPEVRLRAAVHLGPVGEDGGFYQARITHARLLDAPEFKALLKRCRAEGGEDTANTALIVSSEALDTAFSGNHTRLARRGEFGSLPVSHKEYRHNAWVRVPGFDPRTLTSFTSAPAAPDPVARVVNTVHGTNYGIQAGDIHGGITLHTGRRP